MRTEHYFNAIYKETYRDIMTFVIAKTNNADAVEDLVQNVYQNFYKRIRRKGYRDILEPQAFLVTLAKKELSRHYAQRQNVTYTDETIVNDTAGGRPFDQLLEDRELVHRIWAVVKRGNLESYKAFTLFYGFDLSLAQIAERLDITEQAAKSRLHRARTLVRQALGKERSDHD